MTLRQCMAIMAAWCAVVLWFSQGWCRGAEGLGARPNVSLQFYKWDREDVVLELAYIALHAVDMAQTLQIAREPQFYHELNPLLGEHPDPDDVIMFAATSLLVQLAVAAVLPTKYRKIYLGFCLGSKFSLTFYNDRRGLTDWRGGE